jgi:hypothetical protein
VEQHGLEFFRPRGSRKFVVCSEAGNIGLNADVRQYLSLGDSDIIKIAIYDLMAALDIALP